MFLMPASRGRPRFRPADGLRYIDIVPTVSSNLLTVTISPNRIIGAPVYLSFRDSTSSAGDLVWRRIPLMVINTVATGASLGSSNAAAFRFWVVAFDNNGSIIPALINCGTSTQIFSLVESQTTSTTAISGSAASAGIFYTPAGVNLTSKSFRILGYIEYNSTGLATAGTYATAPNFVQVFGPGIKKPGDVIQGVSASNLAGVGNITSTSFTTVSNSAFPSFSMSSAANLIRYDISCTSSVQQLTATNVNVQTQPLRGSTAIGAIVVFQAPSGAGGVGSGGGTPFSGYDFPNSTSSLTYQLQAKTSNASAPAQVGPISGHIEEIMV